MKGLAPTNAPANAPADLQSAGNLLPTDFKSIGAWTYRLLPTIGKFIGAWTGA